MRLIFIRHAEPDYEHDSLTEKGWREAKLLAVRTKSWQVDDFYVSPLGRAQDTASFTLLEQGKTAAVMDWLHEFQGALPDWTRCLRHTAIPGTVDIIPAGKPVKKRSSASVTLALQRFCCPICGTSARLPCCTVRFLLRHP